LKVLGLCKKDPNGGSKCCSCARKQGDPTCKEKLKSFMKRIGTSIKKFFQATLVEYLKIFYDTFRWPHKKDKADEDLKS